MELLLMIVEQQKSIEYFSIPENVREMCEYQANINKEKERLRLKLESMNLFEKKGNDDDDDKSSENSADDSEDEDEFELLDFTKNTEENAEEKYQKQSQHEYQLICYFVVA